MGEEKKKQKDFQEDLEKESVLEDQCWSVSDDVEPGECLND